MSEEEKLKELAEHTTFYKIVVKEDYKHGMVVFVIDNRSYSLTIEQARKFALGLRQSANHLEKSWISSQK